MDENEVKQGSTIINRLPDFAIEFLFQFVTVFFISHVKKTS